MVVDVIEAFIANEVGWHTPAMRAQAEDLLEAITNAGFNVVEWQPDTMCDIDFLRRWRAEATAVLDEWERVWDAAGRPGRPGCSKAAAVLGWVQGQ